MAQPRKDRSLAHETLFRRPTQQRGVEELYRRPAFVPAIAAPREPYGSHAAVTENRLERVSTEPLAGETRGGAPREAIEVVEQRFTGDALLLVKQRTDDGRGLGCVRIEPCEPVCELRLIELQRLIEVAADFLPPALLIARSRHGVCARSARKQIAAFERS